MVASEETDLGSASRPEVTVDDAALEGCGFNSLRRKIREALIAIAAAIIAALIVGWIYECWLRHLLCGC